MTHGLSSTGIARMRRVLRERVDSGFVPGMAIAVRRHGTTHVEAVGRLSFDGPGSTTPIAADTVCRMGSMTKPVVAACAMTLVEDGTIGLDDPVDELLPELADMTVVADPLGPITDTVPAIRPITLRDLLTFTAGTGFVVAEPGSSPIAEALDEIGAAPADEWIRRLGELPLVHQPGERWLYDTPAAITGVLIRRATGTSLDEAVRLRIADPLGMADTGFSVPDSAMGRFATAYARDDVDGRAVVEDRPAITWNRPPTFENGGGGLVATADDFLAFASMLLAGGVHDGRRVLTPESVALMTTDHLTAEQKAVSGFRPDYFDAMGWGFGMSVVTRRARPGPSVGSYGWSGFHGTAWYTDPVEDMTTVVVMQRAHMGDQTLPMWDDVWAAVYAAIDD